ncbi:MAG: hypothetical protein OXD46_07640 [Chloroflexi bacterium]|nr:hypothetical protein [Chloroflexota bacterium]
MSFLQSLKLWGSLMALAFVALVPWGVVEAQEQEQPVEIFDATQGSYHLVVRVLPRVPAVGPINFTVIPTAASDGAPVRDADITLVSHNVEDEPIYEVKALNTPINEGEYVGNLVIKASGAWSIHVEIETEDLGTEVFVARISVAPAAVGSTPEAGWMMLLVMVAFVAGGGFLWLSSRRALARRAASEPKA